MFLTLLVVSAYVNHREERWRKEKGNGLIVTQIQITGCREQAVLFKFICLKSCQQLSFDVLLTVHLSIMLVINQLNAQNSCFIICLLYASTCFEHCVLIVRRSKLYYTASGIITVCRWPYRARPVHVTATYTA